MLSGIAGVGTVLDEYTHDPLDQLVRARYDAGSGTPMRDVQYSFDGVGNRLSVDDNGAVTPYVANDLNQYTSVGGFGLTYDANGNLATGPGFTLTYDAQNRLIQATAATGSVTFAYDGRNRCVKRTTLTLEGGSSTWFVWGHAQSGQWGLLEERDSSGDLVARYVHGDRIDEILRREGPEGTVFYHHDALGSTIALTDATGALVEQYRFDVYGLPTIMDASGSDLGSRTSALGNRFLFTGREWLADLALYDYRHRVYSPHLGRWLQPDPIGFEAGDVNLYRYCINSCVVAGDPMGLAGEWKMGGGAWGVVGTIVGIAGGAIILAATSPAWITAGAVAVIGGGVLVVVDMCAGSEGAQEIPRKAVDKGKRSDEFGNPSRGSYLMDSDGDGTPDYLDETPLPSRYGDRYK